MKPRFFVGIDGGLSRLPFLKEIPSFKENNPAFGINLGMMFNQYVGLQLSLDNYLKQTQEETLSLDNEGLYYVKSETDIYNISLSLLLNYPLYKGWAVYGQAGIDLR